MSMMKSKLTMESKVAMTGSAKTLGLNEMLIGMLMA